MRKSVEISGKTFTYFVGALILMSGLIFFINKYDNDKKLEKIELALKELVVFDSNEIDSVLLNADLNSLTEQEVGRIKNNLSLLDNNEALKNIRRYSSQILIKDGSDFYKIEYRELGYYGNRVRDGENIVKYTVLSQKESEFVRLIEGENVEVIKLILNKFSFMDFPKIIFPFGFNERRKIYFSFSYSEDK